MTSTAQERLFLIYETYSQAYGRRAQDWKEATSKAQADAIFQNVERLEGLYLKAAKQALDASGPDIETALLAAKAAQKLVNDAYQNATNLAEKIRLVGGMIGRVGDLIKKAGGL